MWITPLHPSDRFALEQFLLQHTGANLVPLNVLAYTGLDPAADATWEGALRGRTGRTLIAAALRMGRTPEGWAAAAPTGDPAGCRALGEAARGARVELVLAPRPAADAWWEGFGGPPARVWSDHRLYLCAEPSPGPRLPLRRARLDELQLLVDVSAEMELEDFGADPRLEDAETHRADVRRKIEEGRVWVGERGSDIVFKGDVGLVSGRGALVGGLWVSRARRGEGLGQAGLRTLTDVLLRASPMVGLHVREDNAPALGAYRGAGYRPDLPFRLILAAR